MAQNVVDVAAHRFALLCQFEFTLQFFPDRGPFHDPAGHQQKHEGGQDANERPKPFLRRVQDQPRGSSDERDHRSRNDRALHGQPESTHGQEERRHGGAVRSGRRDHQGHGQQQDQAPEERVDQVAAVRERDLVDPGDHVQHGEQTDTRQPERLEAVRYRRGQHIRHREEQEHQPHGGVENIAPAGGPVGGILGRGFLRGLSVTGDRAHVRAVALRAANRATAAKITAHTPTLASSIHTLSCSAVPSTATTHPSVMG